MPDHMCNSRCEPPKHAHMILVEKGYHQFTLEEVYELYSTYFRAYSDRWKLLAVERAREYPQHAGGPRLSIALDGRPHTRTDSFEVDRGYVLLLEEVCPG